MLAFRHVPFEDPGLIAPALARTGIAGRNEPHIAEALYEGVAMYAITLSHFQVARGSEL